MTRPTRHTGSGFSSSKGGDSGRGYGRSIREGLRTWPWQGRKLVSPAQDHGAGITAQSLQEEEANEGNGVRCRRAAALGLQRGTPPSGCVDLSNGWTHQAPKLDDINHPWADPVWVPD